MKYIYSIRKSFQGAYVINGTIGTRTYFYYNKKDSIKEYNSEAKEDDLLYNKGNKLKMKSKGSI